MQTYCCPGTGLATMPRAGLNLRLLSLALLALCVAQLVEAKRVEGVNFPESVRLTPDGPALIFNGGGLRRIFWMRVYVIGLYLPAKRSSTEDVVALKGPKRMLMVIERNEITAQQFIDHLQRRINDKRQADEMGALKTRIDELYRVIEAEGTIRKGGTIALDYLPDRGTVIRVNDQIKGRPIAGEAFYNALLRIWIGESAPDAALREGMLGQ